MNMALRQIRRNWQLYALAALPLAYLIVFHYIPMAGAQIAFRDYNFADGIWGSPWVGLEHFRAFLEAPSFWPVVRNTLFIGLTNLVFTFPAPIVLALLLNEIRTGYFRQTVQLFTYAPHFISTVVVCGMVLLFLNPTTGEISRLFDWFGLLPVNYIADADKFKYIYSLSEVWQHTGYASIIYIAALAGINPEMYEAAKVDGASRLQKIVRIDLPGIVPAIVILLILSVGELLGVSYEKIYLLQNSFNLPASEVIPTYVYKIGLLSADYSYSAAIGMFNSVIAFLLLVGVNAISRKVSEHSLW